MLSSCATDSQPEAETRVVDSAINDRANPRLVVTWDPLTVEDGGDYLRQYLIDVVEVDLAASPGSGRRRRRQAIRKIVPRDQTMFEQPANHFTKYTTQVFGELLVGTDRREVAITRPTTVQTLEQGQ